VTGFPRAAEAPQWLRWLSAFSLPVPNTFFEALLLLLPMAEESGSGSGVGHAKRGRSVQKLAPMIVRPDFIEDEKDEQCADDRKDQAGRMKQSAVTGPGKHPGDQPADNRTNDSKQGRQEEIHVQMHDQPGDESGNKADNDIPNDV